MALVGDIQLQTSAVKPPNLDTSLRFSAEGLTATTAFAVTDAGAGTTVTPLGLFTAQSANDISAYFNTTNTNGDVNLYLNNDANPYWNVKLSATAATTDSFMIANACGFDTVNDCACEYPAFSISPAGAVGIGKTGASNILDVTYANSTTGGVVITESTNSVATKIISLATCSVMGTSTNHKLGFITNDTTVGMFDTSGNLGIGTEAPGATLDVRGSAIFNEAGAAVDFRIEGDTEANLFLVDASCDMIGIGTATPDAMLHLDNGCNTNLLMCVNGCICAAGYIGEKAGHTIQCSETDMATRGNLNFVVTGAGSVVDDSGNDATVVCISGANTSVPFLLCDGSTSDPITLVGGSIGNGVKNDPSPCLAANLNGCDFDLCCVCCIGIKGCYFGDGSQLTGVSSVPSSFSGDCTIIGCSAGGSVAAGGANIVLIGSNAGYNATTPCDVVVLGSSAALCMTTACQQVLIGTGAGRCVLTCAGNVALGYHTLYNECAGTYNTSIGNNAGLTQKGATTNVFVGAEAGTADTTGSGNVFIGYKAGCANTTGSCCLIIGNGTCDLITGDFNGGTVGFAAVSTASVFCNTLTVGVNDTGHDVTFFGATSGCKFLWDEDANTLILCAAAITTGASVLCNTLTVGVDDTGHDVKFFGASAGAFMLYDESANTLDVRGATAAGPGVLKLTTGELTNVDGGILGRLEFQAPLDSAGTDACVVAASIRAEARCTFSASLNTTDLVFSTAHSGAAAETMRVYGAGGEGQAVGIGGSGTRDINCFFYHKSTAHGLVIYNANTGASTYSSELTLAAAATNTQAWINFSHAYPAGPACTGSGAIKYDFNTDSLQFMTNGLNQSWRMDSNGNIGIGTAIGSDVVSCASAPTFVQIKDATFSQIILDVTGVAQWGFGTCGSGMKWLCNNTEFGRVDCCGFLGIKVDARDMQCYFFQGGNASGMVVMNSYCGTIANHSLHSAELTLTAISLSTQAALNFTRVTGAGGGVNDSPRCQQTGQIMYNYNTDDMYLKTNGTTHMCISCLGAVSVVGAFSKGSGSFRIEHPLESKKDTHHLVHSFIEGPQADLMYRGVIELTDGSAQINVDTASGMTEGTFVSLNRCVQAFTNNESNWDNVRGSVTGNTLTIESNDSASTASISWMVIGERCDEHMMDTSWTDNDGKVIVEPVRDRRSTMGEARLRCNRK